MSNTNKKLLEALKEKEQTIEQLTKWIKDIEKSLSFRFGFKSTYPLRVVLDKLSARKTIKIPKLINSGIKISRPKISTKPNVVIDTNLRDKDVSGYVDEKTDKKINGWFKHTKNSKVRLKLSISDGKSIHIVTCDKFRQDLFDNKTGDGNYGFLFNFPEDFDSSSVKITLASWQDLKKTFQGNFDKIEMGRASGWLWNSTSKEPVEVSLYFNDKLIKTELAGNYRSDLVHAKIGNGKHGFSIPIPPSCLIAKTGKFIIRTKDGFELGPIEWEYRSSNYVSLDSNLSESTSVIVPSFGKPTQKNNSDLKIAVHIHAFYIDVLKTIISRIKHIPLLDAVFISYSSIELKEGIEQEIAKNLNDKKVVVANVQNRGRDIGPMLIDFSDELLKFDLVLHLHTKKSAHNLELGQIWMDYILESLAYSNTHIYNIIELFRCNKKLGIVAPKVIDELRPYYNWGDNYKNAVSVMKEIEIDENILPKKNIEFPAGTMLWFRPKSIERLLNWDLDYNLFPKEPIEPDGTIAHAIERCLYYIAKSAGYQYLTVTPIHYLRDTGPVTISIIIPIYNAQKWLHQAINSILNQVNFYEKFEIILVNNNSDDNSIDICNQYVSLFPKHIKLFHESEKGAGNARNKGIKNSTGKYLLFLDSDDVLAPRALQTLFENSVSNNSELIVSPLIIFNEKGYKAASPEYYSNGDCQIVLNDNIKNVTQNDVTFNYLDSLFSDFGPCAKLYSAEFLKQNDLLFPESTNYEDNIFIYQVYFSAKKISVCQTPTYFYRKLESESGNTQSTVQDEDSLIDQMNVLEVILFKIRANDTKFDKFVFPNLIRKLRWLFDVVENLPSVESEFYIKLKRILQPISNQILNDEGRHYANFLAQIKSGAFNEAFNKFKKIEI